MIDITKFVKPEEQKRIDETSGYFQQYTYQDMESGITLEYSLRIPEGYDDSQKYPLIMYIPDATGAHKSAKKIVEQYYGSAVFASLAEQRKHPCFVFVPAFSEVVVDDDWNTSEQITAAYHALKHIMETYAVDPKRIYTTGQSMGCMTSLYLNSQYPDVFAGCLFVSGQWDIHVLKGLESTNFFYIVASGDDKAFNGQKEVIHMFEEDHVSYGYGEWSAKLPLDRQNALVKEMLKENNNANMIRFEKGSVLEEADGFEHMYSFNYAYRLESVRDWLFEQRK